MSDGNAQAARDHLDRHQQQLVAQGSRTVTVDITVAGNGALQASEQDLQDYLRWSLLVPGALDLDELALDISAMLVTDAKIRTSGGPMSEQRMHRADPADADAGTTSCVACKEEVKKVPGGQGTTWVHTKTGAVAAPGAPTR